MSKLYKLTNIDKTTKNGMKWGYRVVNELPAKTNPQLCSADVIHAYESLEVAMFMRHLHGYEHDNVICFEADGAIVVRDAAKCGVFKLKTGKMVELPKPNLKQIVLFGLLCTKSIYNHESMDAAIAAAKAGDFSAAARAARAAYAAARAAARADAAAWDAAAAAWAAAWAADAAARAADAAAYGAAYAAAYSAAYSAAFAADAAAIDLKAIAIEALSHA